MQIYHTLEGDFPSETAVAVGFFDGVHLGHRAVISRALGRQSEGLVPVVFSFSIDGEAPAGKRSARFLTSEEQKAEKLAALGVGLLLEPPFSAIRGETPEEYARFLAKRLHARVVCCGYDYRFGRGAEAGPEELRRLLSPYGVRVEAVDAVLDRGEPVSSTRIRTLLEQGEPLEAARLLGAPFALDAPVVHGRRLGRSLGFPTANQRFPQGFLVPKFGVYAARVTANGVAYPAVTNVGVKPTVGDALPGAESCLLDFSGDLYGRTIRTEFLAFLRPERRFDSLEALQEQIARDAAAARALFAAR